MIFFGHSNIINFKNIRPYVLPFAIVFGSIFHSFFSRIHDVAPYIIGVILFLTFCEVDFKKIKIQTYHLWLLAFQLILSIVFYLILLPFSSIIAQGALIGILAPVAASSTVVAVMIGADMNSMVSYTILGNLAIALAAPIYFSFVGTQNGNPFWPSFWNIIMKVSPVIVLSLGFAYIVQKRIKKLHKLIIKYKTLPFYLWSIALSTVIGVSTDFIIKQYHTEYKIIWLMVPISIIECLMSFGFGRWIGKKYGYKVSGGQALGHKNGILAVWMSQAFLNPLASIVPALYILWQNIWNSVMIWRSNNVSKLDDNK